MLSFHGRGSLQLVRLVRTLRRLPKASSSVETQLASLPPDHQRQALEQFRQDTSEPPLSGKLDKDDLSERLIRQYLESVEAPSALDGDFWEAVLSLARSAARKKNPQFLELFANLFEIAKLEDDPLVRQRLIYEIGRYIYRLRVVRLDPINEIEFLDALVSNHRAYRALQFWGSRQGREEVAGSPYWAEVGVLYHLDAGLIARADSLAIEMGQNFKGFISPNVIISLIGAYSHQIRRGKGLDHSRERLHFWIGELIRLGTEETRHPEQISMSADDKLYERCPVLPTDLSKVLNILIVSRQWESAAELLSHIDEPDTGAQELSEALKASSNTKSFGDGEASYLSFLRAVLTKRPELAIDPNINAQLVLSFARMGDVSDALATLEDLLSRGVQIPDKDQEAITESILDSSQGSIATINEVLTLMKSAGTVTTVLRLRRKFGTTYAEAAVSAARNYLEEGKELSPELALEAVRARIYDDERITHVAVDARTWGHIWHLIATNSIQVPPWRMLSIMVNTPGIEYIQWSPRLIQCIMQAFVLDASDKGAAAMNAGAAMLVLDEKLTIPLTIAETAYLLAILKRRPRARRSNLASPGDVRDSKPENRVPWKLAMSYIARAEKNNLLPQAARERADVFLEENKANI